MERRRTRYPGIYEYMARGGRRRYQVVFRTGRAVDAPQRAASFDTLKDARDYQISQSHRVREGTYFDPKEGEISLTEFFHEFMRLAGPEEPKSRANYEANFRNHVEPVLGSLAIREVDAEAVAELLATIRAKRRRLRGDGKATVRQVHALVRRTFNVAVKLGRLLRYFPNPAAAIQVPNPEPCGRLMSGRPAVSRNERSQEAQRLRIDEIGNPEFPQPAQKRRIHAREGRLDDRSMQLCRRVEQRRSGEQALDDMALE